MKKLNDSGIAHLLVLVSLLVVVGVGGVGYYVYTKSSANSLSKLPADVSATFTPKDWKLTKYSKLVKDAQQGTVLQASVNGMETDGLALASIPGTDSRWQQFNDFEGASFAAKDSNYKLTTCVDFKYVIENQNLKNFPFVSNFVAHIGTVSMSYNDNGNGWTMKECRTQDRIVRMNFSTKDIFNRATYKQFTAYSKGLDLTTKTYLSDKPNLNPPVKGKIYIKNVTMTASQGVTKPASKGLYFWR